MFFYVLAIICVENNSVISMSESLSKAEGSSYTRFRPEVVCDRGSITAATFFSMLMVHSFTTLSKLVSRGGNKAHRGKVKQVTIRCRFV